MVHMRIVSFQRYMIHGDISKFSTSHRMSSHRILKTHWFHPYNFLWKNDGSKKTSLEVPPLPPMPLYTLRRVPLYLYTFYFFFLTSILIQLNSPYSQVPGVKGGIDFTTFFPSLFSLLFFSSFFLKKKLNSLRI